MQEINMWLQGGQNYKTGLALYSKYGKSVFLKEIFSKGPSPFNTQKLVAELIKLAPAKPANKIPIIPVIPIIPIIPDVAKVQLNSKEDQVRYLAIKEDIKLRYRQMENSMVALDQQKDENILHQFAKQILKLHSIIRKNWILVDHYDEHGYFPFDAIKKPPITSEMQRLHVSISKAKKRLKSPDCRDREKTEKLLIEKEAALSVLQAHLKHKSNDE